MHEHNKRPTEVLGGWVEHLRRAPRMMVFDDRYITQVALVCGWLMALGRESDPGIDVGFREWVLRNVVHGYSPVHWSYTIAMEIDREYATGTRRLADMSTENQQKACALMQEYLLKFVEEQEIPFSAGA